MADNVAITAGTGTSIATDDEGGNHYQKMKIYSGTSGETHGAPVTTTRGLFVDPRGTTLRVSDTPTISTSIYAAKDAVGDLMEFTSSARFSTGGGVINAVTIVDKDQEMAALDLVLFDQTVAGTVTDNAAFDPTDGDLSNCLGVVPVYAGDYHDFNDNSVASVRGIGLPYTCNSTSIFGVLVARGTPTYTATSDIVVILTLLQD